LHPPSVDDSAGLLGTQLRLATSQTEPNAQSALSLQRARHTPNAGSQVYGAQSKGTTSSVAHAAPGAGQYAGPTPVVVVVQRLRAHIVPPTAPMHCPLPSQVPRH
jgi:hypothetical protein